VQQARAAAQEASTARDAARFQCLDASGVHLAMPRLDGRAPRGERVGGTGPPTSGAHVTLLAALGRHGVEAVMPLDGAPEAEVVRASVDPGRRPTRRPGDRVRMANVRAPTATGSREAREQTGARLPYWPPYSPALAPIEPCWSKLKPAWRAAQARPREALEHAVAQALATITVSDAHRWFRHGGYA
jgi:transposase